MLDRIKKYRSRLVGSPLGRVCTVGVHLSLIIFLSGYFNASYGEIGHGMSGYPLMMDEDLRKAEISSSNTGQMAEVPSVEYSQKTQFVADGAGHGASKQGVSGYSTAGSAGFDKSRKVSTSPDVLVNLPPIQSPQRKHGFSSLDSEESVYLAVYLTTVC